MMPYIVRVLVAMGVSVLVVLAHGCGVARVPIDRAIEGDPPRIVVIGDWNDVDAAVDVAASRAELAPLSEQSTRLRDGTREKRYVLLAADDARALLTVRQGVAGAGEQGPGPIEFEAVMSPRRDEAREKRLLSAAASRLRDLAGREWAPLR
ncbi:MAG: hypothetical protein KF859_13590 [Phycisphaeraceae bacterium]|nr:hypothetical protein [Phycisphaeraceae bacterium]